MRRLKKNIFYGLCGGTVAVLVMVRSFYPSVAGPSALEKDAVAPVPSEADMADSLQVSEHKDMAPGDSSVQAVLPKPHPVRSVYSYDKCFPDVQDVQIQSAMRLGVTPVRDREQAEERKSELVYVGASPFYCIDKGMRSSIPYLVPRASNLLQTIGRNFLDSLYVKGIPLHRIIVSSVTRTDEDVARLLRHNPNANEQSCHRYGTTVDIAYNRYSKVEHPNGPTRREVKNDTLKWVLSEVLRDVREQGICYIKHEKKQGCFHITVR